MAFIPFANTVKVTLSFDLHGHLILNVFHVRKPTPILYADMTALTFLFMTWWDDDLSVPFSDEIELNLVEALDLTEEDDKYGSRTVSPPIPGQVVSVALPGQVAIVTSFLTLKSGRSYRGRSYQGGVPEISVEGNTIDAPTIVDILAAYGELETNLALMDFELVVASRQTGGLPREVGVSTVVTEYRSDTRVDTQRRRLG